MTLSGEHFNWYAIELKAFFGKIKVILFSDEFPPSCNVNTF
jgi:hypothetical protein